MYHTFLYCLIAPKMVNCFITPVVHHSKPIESMYGIFAYIYHKNQPNVGNIPSMDAMGKSQENNNITDLDILQTLTPSETKHPHESPHMFSRCNLQQKNDQQTAWNFVQILSFIFKSFHVIR